MPSVRLIKRYWPLLLAGAGAAYWLLYKGVNALGGAAGRLSDQIANLWARIPIPANSLPGIPDPEPTNWADSNLNESWRQGWFDRYRVLTIADVGDLGELNGYLEFEKTIMRAQGEHIPGIYGNPISLVYLGEAISRVSDIGPVEFSLLPEQCMTHPILARLSLIDPGSGIPGIRRQFFLFRKLAKGQAFVFKSPEQAGRVIRRLVTFCEAKWLTASGWHWQHPLRAKPASNYTLPFVGGTVVIISSMPSWSVVLANGVKAMPDNLKVHVGRQEDSFYSGAGDAGFIPDGPPPISEE